MAEPVPHIDLNELVTGVKVVGQLKHASRTPMEDFCYYQAIAQLRTTIFRLAKVFETEISMIRKMEYPPGMHRSWNELNVKMKEASVLLNTK